MKTAIYKPVNYGSDKELFMAGMRDTVLQMVSSSLFGPFVAILAPHLGQPINLVTHTVADLEEVKQCGHGRECRQLLRRSVGLKGPVKVMSTQM